MSYILTIYIFSQHVFIKISYDTLAECNWHKDYIVALWDEPPTSIWCKKAPGV